MVKIEVEVETLDELDQALAAGADESAMGMTRMFVSREVLVARTLPVRVGNPSVEQNTAPVVIADYIPGKPLVARLFVRFFEAPNGAK